MRAPCSLRIALLLSSAAMFSSIGRGQAVSIAEVSGIIADPSGSPIPNAKVKIT